MIELEAGKVYQGPIRLRAKNADSYITIQSSRASELPEGVRVGPAQSALFAKLQSSYARGTVIKTAAGSHHYRFIGSISPRLTADVLVYDLVRIGDTRQTAAEVPHDIVIRPELDSWL